MSPKLIKATVGSSNRYMIGLVYNHAKKNGKQLVYLHTDINESNRMGYPKGYEKGKSNSMSRRVSKSKYFKKVVIRIEGFKDERKPIMFHINEWVIITPCSGKKTNLTNKIGPEDERLIKHIKTMIGKAFEESRRFGRFVTKKLVNQVTIKEKLIKIFENNPEICDTLKSLSPKKLCRANLIVEDEEEHAKEVICNNEVLSDTQSKDTVGDKDSQLSLPEIEKNGFSSRQMPFVDGAEKNNCEERMDERPNEEMLIPVVFEGLTTQITPSPALLSNPLTNPPSNPSSTQTTTSSTTLPTQNEEHGEDEEDERRSRKRSKPTTESEGPRPKQEFEENNTHFNAQNIIIIQVINQFIVTQPTRPTQEVESSQSTQPKQ